MPYSSSANQIISQQQNVNHTPAYNMDSSNILAGAREFIPSRLYFTSIQKSQHSKLIAASNIHAFSIDASLVYVNFYSDFGPNNFSHVLRFCDMVNSKLQIPRNENKKVLLFSSLDADKRANAAFLMCAYMLIVHRQSPEDAFRPLIGMQMPFIPYRDAGYGAATYHITILDCLQGLHKGLVTGLIDLDTFDLEEYEFYEKVENGDLNWLSGKFVAMANPKDDDQIPPHLRALVESQPRNSLQQRQQASQMRQVSGQAPVGLAQQHYTLRSSTIASSKNSQVNSLTGWAASGISSLLGRAYNQGPAATVQNDTHTPSYKRQLARPLISAYCMDDLVCLLQRRDVQTVVRLNNKTYDKSKIVDGGIEHVEMYFPDGTTPSDGILMRFLELCESRPGPIAVHCKAGLGRTGTLIASYFMKHYKFTAAEIIALMRILRPGSVVGPQQNYLQAMQARLWRLEPQQALAPEISCVTATNWPECKRYPLANAYAALERSSSMALERAASDLSMASSDGNAKESTMNSVDSLASAVRDLSSAMAVHEERDPHTLSSMAIPVQPRKKDVLRQSESKANRNEASISASSTSTSESTLGQAGNSSTEHTPKTERSKAPSAASYGSYTTANGKRRTVANGGQSAQSTYSNPVNVPRAAYAAQKENPIKERSLTSSSPVEGMATRSKMAANAVSATANGSQAWGRNSKNSR